MKNRHAPPKLPRLLLAARAACLAVVTFALLGTPSLLAQTPTQNTAPPGTSGGEVGNSGAQIVAHTATGHAIGGGVSNTVGTVQEKGGYTGQLYDPTVFNVTPASSTVDEETAVQLTANATMDDGTTLVADPSTVTWSVAFGPLAGIDGAGLATAEAVLADTAAQAAATFLSASNTADVTVLDTNPDNFGLYAADGITDQWQVDNFGNPPVAAGQGGANPDGDPYTNFFEFAIGSDPNAATGLLVADIPGGTFTPGGPVTHVEFDPLRVTYRFTRHANAGGVGLTYTPIFSNDMTVFFPESSAPTLLVPDPGTGYELVEVPYTVFLPNGRKGQFSQLEISAD